MTTKDIIYLKSTDPITLLDSPPSPETIEFVNFILNNSTLSPLIDSMREQNKLPKTGIDIKSLIGKDLTKSTNAGIENVVWSIYLVIDGLRAQLGLSEKLIDQFVLLICFNACIDLKYFTGFISNPIQFISGKKNIASAMFEYPHEVGAILIPYTTSQNQLIKWIENNWKDMGNKIDETLVQNPYMIRIHKNTEIASEIIDMHDRQKLSFIQIADILSKKYPDDKRLLSEEWIKDTYYFFTKGILAIKPPETKK